MAKKNYMASGAAPRAESPLFWQALYRQCMQAADTLSALERKRKKDSIDRDALWHGYWSCKERASRYVDHGKADGALLTMFMP